MQTQINTIKTSINSIMRTKDIIKSKFNENDYLYKQLSNGVKYIIVQDNKTDKSYASFCLNVGSLNDPDEYQGLAHFLEHMVFMGSKQYPGENEYNDFLTKNSGYSNAFTDFSMTNYYFDCSNDSFLEALKMTSRFLIDPLLNESSVEREINAVDSEFKNSLREDNSKIQEILSKESNKDTPFTKFMCGNLISLKKPGLLEALKNFFNKHYSADIVTVVIYTNINLDLIENKVDLILSEIPNKNLNMRNNLNQIISNNDIRNYIKNNKYPYDESNCGMLYKYAGIIDKNRISFEWNINISYDQYYLKKPLDFILGLLSSNTSESFIFNLINDNLITDGSAYIYNYANSYVKLTIDLDLTNEGFEDYLEVIKRVLVSVNKLKKLPIKKIFFEQMKKMSDLNFQYHVEDDISEFVTECACNLHTYDAKNILYGDFLINEYEEELIRYFFEYLKNDYLNIYLISNKFQENFENEKFIKSSSISDFNHPTLIHEKEINKINDMELDNNQINENYFVEIRKEEIYDSKYTYEKIDFSKLNLEIFIFNDIDKIDYPSENYLIPENIKFIVDYEQISNENSKIPPRLILENEHYTIHYKQDLAFYQPLIYIYGKIYIENLNIKNRNGKLFSLDEVTCYMKLWLELVEKEMFERNSIANFSGYLFDFYDDFNYLILKISGYNDHNKFSEFIKFNYDYFIELHDITNIKNFRTKIITLITESIKSLRNIDYDSASSQAMEKFREISYINYCNKDTNINILENLKNKVLLNNDWNDFNDFINNYLEKNYINWLVQGHISEINAIESVKYLSNKIQNRNLNESFNFYSNNEILNDIHTNKFMIHKNLPVSSQFKKSNCIGLDLIKYDYGKHYYHSFLSKDPKNKNSAILTYFILGQLSDKEKCMSLLIQTILSDEFFDDLRTKQCLGYTCSFSLKKHFIIDSFCCLVESSVKPPEHITNKITKFLYDNNPKLLLDDPDYKEDFQKYKNSIIIDLKKKDFILENEVDRNFEEICKRDYDFEKYSKWIKIIENLTLEEVKIFYQEMFIYNPSRIDIGFISQNMIDENNILLEKNLKSSYSDIITDEEEEEEEDEEDEDDEYEEEDEEDEESEISIELPERIRIIDENFKLCMDSYKINLLY